MVIELFLQWVKNAPVSKRVEAAAALMEGLKRSDISPNERDDLIASMTALAEDNSPAVRLALANALGSERVAPRHIVLSLAYDSEQISNVILSNSTVLHDVELVELLEFVGENGQVCIAQRPWVSPKVCDVIALVGSQRSVIALLENEGAEIAASSLHQIAVRLGENRSVRGLLAARNDLAAHTRLLLVDKLGGALQSFVSEQGWLSKQRSKRVVADACERASIIFAANTTDEELQHIVDDRINNDKVTVAYLLRSVCMGNIALFTRALSSLSGANVTKAEASINVGNGAIFKALYDRAGLPNEAFYLFATAIDAWAKVLERNREIASQEMAVTVMRKVIEKYCQIATSESDELLAMLRRWLAEATRELALYKLYEADCEVKRKAAAEEEADLLTEQMAAQLAAELADEFEEQAVTVSIPEVFDNDNIAEIASELDADIDPLDKEMFEALDQYLSIELGGSKPDAQAA